MQPADVVILEGIMVLHMPEVREMLNMKVTLGQLPIAAAPGAMLHTSLSPNTCADVHACHRYMLTLTMMCGWHGGELPYRSSV